MEDNKSYKVKSNHGNYDAEIKVKNLDNDSKNPYKTPSANKNNKVISSGVQSNSGNTGTKNNRFLKNANPNSDNKNVKNSNTENNTPTAGENPNNVPTTNPESKENIPEGQKNKSDKAPAKNSEKNDKNNQENTKAQQTDGSQEKTEDTSDGSLKPVGNSDDSTNNIVPAKSNLVDSSNNTESVPENQIESQGDTEPQNQPVQNNELPQNTSGQEVQQPQNTSGQEVQPPQNTSGQSNDKSKKDGFLSKTGAKLSSTADDLGEASEGIQNIIPDTVNMIDQKLEARADERKIKKLQDEAYSKAKREFESDENAKKAADKVKEDYFKNKKWESLTPKGIAKNFARKAVKRKVINKIENTKLGNTVQEVSNNLSKVTSAIRKVVKTVEFTVEHYKGMAIIACIVGFSILLITIIAGICGVSGGSYTVVLDQKKSSNSISYYEDNFTMAKITLVDANGVTIYEDLTMQELLTGMAYKALGSDACEEQYKAYMAVAKADLLSKADFNSSELNITLINDETGVQYCPASDGCYQCDTLSTIYSEATKDKCSGTLTDISAASSETITKLNSAYTATEYYILAPKIDEEAGETYDFSTIDYGGNLLSSTVLTSIADSTNCDTDYQTLLSGITELADYQVVDARDYLQVYYTSGCDSGEWWVPIGNDSCTPGSICSEDPYSDTFIYLYYGFTYSDGSFHKGVDIERPTRDLSYGTPIIASRGGTVEWVQNDIVGVHTTGNASYGNVVKINHGDGYVSYYEHMITGSIVVKEGDTVSQGQYLGQMGTTGYSTGVHVHFQIEYEGATDAVNGHTVDPTDYIDLDNPRPSGDTNCGMGFSGDYSSTTSGKDVFCSSLKSIGLSSNAIAAVMANAGEESGYRSNNLEDCYQENSKQCYFKSGKAYGYRQHPELQGFGTDELYTNGVDSGKYSRDNFVNDCAGYGLVQFTDSGLKANLYDFAKEKGASIGSMQMQLDYMINYEIKTSYAEVYQYLISNRSAGEISSYFCYNFERPNDPYTVCPRREANAPSYLTYINNNCSD